MLSGLVVMDLFNLKKVKVIGGAMIWYRRTRPMYFNYNEGDDFTITITMKKLSIYDKNILYSQLQELTTSPYSVFQSYDGLSFVLKPFDLLDINNVNDHFIEVYIHGLSYVNR